MLRSSSGHQNAAALSTTRDEGLLRFISSGIALLSRRSGIRLPISADRGRRQQVRVLAVDYAPGDLVVEYAGRRVTLGAVRCI